MLCKLPHGEVGLKLMRKHVLRWCCTALALVSGFCAAQVPDCATPAQGQELTPSLVAKLDTDSLLDASSAFKAWQAGEFEKVHGSGQDHSFGFVKGSVWLSFELPAPAESCTSLLVIPQSRLDRVELFPFVDGKMQTPLLMGDSIDFNERSEPHRYLNVRMLRLADRPAQVMMRVQSTSSIQTPLWLHTEASLLRSTHNEQIGEGIYFGILLALLLYNFAVMISIREESYFYYVAYALSFALLMLSFSGYGFQFLWPNNPTWQNVSLPISLALLLASSVGFARTFLNLREKVPGLNRVALLAFPIAFVLGVIACIPGMLLPATIGLNIALVGFSVVVTAAAILSAVRGYRPAVYFLLAWSLLMLGGVALPLSSFGLLPRSVITEYGLQLGSAAEMLLLSFSMAYRITLLRDENARIELDARLNLEVRVDQRTRELAQIAQQLGDANQRLSNMSLRDGLTGIFNRRYLDEMLPATMAACFENHLPLAVLMVDIDHFKQVNDEHGHGIGDDCLKLLASRLVLVVHGEKDFTARYGGEEFVIVLFDADIVKATATAQRLQSDLTEFPLEIESGPLPLTLSIGIASAQSGTAGELLDIADKALYRAKRTGRNRICVV